MATSEQQVEDVLQEFQEAYGAAYTVWGISVGAGPSEYNEYGVPRHREKSDYRDFALHVFLDKEEFVDQIPSIFKGVPVMVFVTTQTWSKGDMEGISFKPMG